MKHYNNKKLYPLLHIGNKIRVQDQILKTKRTSTKVCSHQKRKKRKKRVRKETVEIYY